MMTTKRYATLDVFRLICTFLIIAIHTSPLTSINITADMILTRVIARIAVPFFFMVTGYFMYSRIVKGDNHYIGNFIGKTGITYLVAILLYLPLNIYTQYFRKPDLFHQIVKDIIFDGTFYHLWYLPAVMIGVTLIVLLLQKLKIYHVLLLSLLLYIIGLFGDSYYGISSHITGVKSFYQFIFQFSDYTRNGLFFAPLFLSLGAWVADRKEAIHPPKCMIYLIVSTIFLFAEAIVLHIYEIPRHDSMYIMLVPCMYFLFQFLLQYNGKNKKDFRTLSMLIYLIHPWLIVLVMRFAKITHFQKILIDNSIIHFVSVSLGSLVVAWFLISLWPMIKKTSPIETSRAWVEIDLNALTHNARLLQKALPKSCNLMAVVKANAYGHGDIAVSSALNKIGIRAFAVATLAEGIHLRKHGIKGDILILGYTNPVENDCLKRYHLIQSVLNYEYAEELNRLGKSIHVHIKIDTGMHRLGEDYNEIEKIEAIFSMKNLIVEGLFTHLCTADSLNKKDVIYSNKQVDRFYETISIIKSKGYSTGKLHIQSSYGILNYPGITCDYARAGIALYGVLSNDSKTLLSLDLQPVLSLKARVGMVKNIAAQESVSYGRLFTAETDMTIATVTIGYSDGVPRNLFEADAYVLLQGKKAPIIGRICMDQFVINVSDIPSVKPNDVVTLIGTDGYEQIFCEDFAMKCGTITNEILSRLGHRLDYVYIK